MTRYSWKFVNAIRCYKWNIAGNSYCFYYFCSLLPSTFWKKICCKDLLSMCCITLTFLDHLWYHLAEERKESCYQQQQVFCYGQGINNLLVFSYYLSLPRPKAKVVQHSQSEKLHTILWSTLAKQEESQNI